MNDGELRRLALFVFVSAVLVASAVAFATGNSDSGEKAAPGEGQPPSRAAALPAAARRTELWAQSMAAAVKRAARRFVLVFARYEVGELPATVRAGLRAAATPRFAAQLLAAPPRSPPPGSFLGKARLGKLDITFVSAQGTQALASGVIRRGASPEEFSFLFERRRGVWLAGGPGQ